MVAKKKQPKPKPKTLTLEQHRELGQSLIKVYDCASTVSTALEKIYSPGDKSAKAAARFCKSVDALRACLEEKLYMEFPKQATDTVYFAEGERARSDGEEE